MSKDTKTALLLIDIQNDFCPGGALAVERGDEVVGVANRLQSRLETTILTQDWHPANHLSFASNQSAEPFSTTEMTYGTQVLWPDHCIQGTAGAAFHGDLETDGADLIIRKGFRPEIDSYSAFFENDHETATGLAGYLRERSIERVVLAGLATDFCVRFSAVDAAKSGFDVVVVEDGCRAIDMEGSLAEAWQEITSLGIMRTTYDQL